MTRAKKGSSKTAKIAAKLFIKPKSVKALPAPEPPTFESLPVDSKQCSKALEALVAFAKKSVEKKSETDLLAGEENEAIWLGVALKQMSPKTSNKAIRIPVPNPLMDPRKNPVCLLVKDPQREYKDLLEEKKIKFISRVVGLDKLQGKFKPFEARRELMKEHDLFLVDDRIMPEMPRVLGKSWLQAKKSPIPVTLKRSDLKAELERAISSTYLRVTTGTSVSIKVGSLEAHTPDQLLENLKAIIPHLAVRLPMGGWANVQALHLKTSTSVALPIWTSSLAQTEENAADSRFFVSTANEEEIAEKKKAKMEKNERIKAKKEKRAEYAARKALEGLSASEEEDEEEDLETVLATAGDESALDVVEDIDESIIVDTPDKSANKKKSSKSAKGAASPANAERKKVSSTSKKSKGLDAVKGLPRKIKK